MKNLLFSILSITILFASSCGGGEIVEPVDPSIQATEDSVTIVNYIEDLGFSDIDSVLASGVHYVILDSGDAERITESDIVDFDFIGKFLSDTLFDTSIKSLSDSARLAVENGITEGDTTDAEYAYLAIYDEDRNSNPIEVVYTASSWTIPRSSTSLNGFVDGFVDGIAASFRHLGIGGHVLIVMPSALGYGVSGRAVTYEVGEEIQSFRLIPENTVIAFELFPVSVERQ